jgi:hypothetical protein
MPQFITITKNGRRKKIPVRVKGTGQGKRTQPVKATDFTIKEVDFIPPNDSYGGSNYWAAHDPFFKDTQPMLPAEKDVILVREDLCATSKNATVHHEKAEAEIMKNTGLDYLHAHSLTNRMDRIYNSKYISPKNKKDK